LQHLHFLGPRLVQTDSYLKLRTPSLSSSASHASPSASPSVFT
jgi:hypothetical protein